MTEIERELRQSQQDSGPVTMLNLLKFRAQCLSGNGTGRDAYMRYAELVQPLIKQREGSVIWVGSVDFAALNEGGDIDWDLAALVYYPSREIFEEMVSSADFLSANVERRDGVEKHVILSATTLINAPFPQPEKST